MRRAVVIILAVLLSLAAVASRAAGTALPDGQCPPAAGFPTTDERLDAVAAAIKAGGPVSILAVGSATTVGQDGKANGISFPYHMVEALRAALPNVAFDLTVKGSRGLAAKDMLTILDAALSSHGFTLVLWQTGTVEAVHGVRPDSLHATLGIGVQHVRARGGDTVLIDPPFSRALRASTDVEPYEQVMRQVAGLPGVVLFPRYDLTRSWVEKAMLDVEKVPLAERPLAVDMLHECVGRALASFVLSGVHRAAP